MQLTDLYREVILDHNRHPRNFGRLDPHDAEARGHNPLCGDRLTLTLQREGDRLADLRFEGNGCAISMASASLMTEAVKGKTLDEAKALFHEFHELVTGQEQPVQAGQPKPPIGKLAVFSGVRDFPVRVKCATLAWHTLNAALDNDVQPVTTE